MSFKISNINDYENFLAIDIWTFKIKVLACKIEWQELKIIGASSLRQSKKDMFNWEISDISSISKALNKAITKACQWIENIPKDVMILYNSSELIYDFTSVNYVRNSKDSLIKMKEIDEMIEGVELRSLDKIKSKTENRLWIIEAEMKLLTTSITWIYVDWKRISNPIWFSWKNIKFNLINIFCPISRFLTLRNIVNDLNFNLISVVPLALSLPKLIEDSSYNFDQNIYIDIGYSKITVILQNNSEIIWFNVISFWLALLEEELKNSLNKSYLDIENILSNIDEKYIEYREIIDNTFNFLFDAIWIAIIDIEKSFFAKNVFVSGAWVSEIFKKLLIESLEKQHFWKQLVILDKFLFEENLEEYNSNWLLSVASLAKSWKDLMSIKKDPLVRIMKYIIYKYE